MADAPFRLTRAVAIWLMLVAVESIHGLMRRLLLEPHFGDLPARELTGAAARASLRPQRRRP